MMSPKKCIATRGGLFIGLLLAYFHALAGQAVGTITDLSGPLLAKKGDGTVKILSQKSEIEQGDVLVTEKDTYARIKFSDNSEITLRPNTQLKIEKFSFAEDKPQDDTSLFSLIKGGLRAVTGIMGKRSREKVGVNTPAATIGIRGTTYVAEYIPAPEADVARYGRASVAALDASVMSNLPRVVSDSTVGRGAYSPAAVEILPMKLAQSAPNGGRAPGLYVQVIDGMIHLTNSGGLQNFAAGQFGYAPNFSQPPVIVPSNPGIQFAPPPTFSSTKSAPQSTNGAASGGTTSAGGNIDCEVR